jgi:hypothetical protein
MYTDRVGDFPGIKRLRHKVYHSHLLSAEIKNELRENFIHPYILVVCTGKFYFYINIFIFSHPRLDLPILLFPSGSSDLTFFMHLSSLQCIVISRFSSSSIWYSNDSLLILRIRKPCFVTCKLDDLKEKRRYWKLKKEALDRTQWRTRFGRGYGPVIRQTTEWMNEWILYLTKSHKFRKQLPKFVCFC